MKLYCKIKIDGVWSWLSADDPWKVATARALCECRVCRPGKPDVVSQEEEDCDCTGAPPHKPSDHLTPEEFHQFGVE
jgi:hypothetical protein